MAKVEKVIDRDTHLSPLRITRRKGRGKQSASFTVRCCCKETLVIHHPSDDEGDTLIEIGGVIGTVHQWQQIFGPLLKMEPKVDI